MKKYIAIDLSVQEIHPEHFCVFDDEEYFIILKLQSPSAFVITYEEVLSVHDMIQTKYHTFAVDFSDNELEHLKKHGFENVSIDTLKKIRTMILIGCICSIDINGKEK